MNRRQMLKRGGLMMAGAAGGAWSGASLAAAEEVRARVNTNSEPSELKITDLRVVPILGSMRSHVIRLDTNQGISGYGEVRDGASPTYA
ncbi:MAG: mandelate racemase/muconate lactonizing enzyme family protein, partial [Verrucomicrobia bacterium]|nr:mandelate racemase/muconate lactonizing enzyme family protein [Verrucomicrobiota bacterium]